LEVYKEWDESKFNLTDDMFETWLGINDACKTISEPGKGVKVNPVFEYATVLHI
jgi:hypothetical protein